MKLLLTGLLLLITAALCGGSIVWVCASYGSWAAERVGK